jgi:threonylcarbamoyladenosine tRNA methylthiotransferase CDKAL1
VPQQSREFAAHAQVGPDSLGCIGEVVARTLAAETVAALRRDNGARLSLPVRRRHAGIEIIPVSKGCLGSCTFCQTVLARGRLHSFPADEIVARVERAAAEGVRVVWLTSQDCGAYGMDTGTTLPALLARVARVPGDFLVRVGMANPDTLGPRAAEFAEALSHPKFLGFAHIPVQSGSSRVLGDMARMHSADDFRRICDTLRARVPGITIATDIIAGFPTETDADWAETLRLLRDTAPGVVNRSRFSPRPGTRAARLPLLPSQTVSARSREAFELARELTRAHLRTAVGTLQPAHAEDQPKAGVTVFRTRDYRPVVIAGSHRIGADALVSVTGLESFHLCGEVEAQAVAVPRQ